MKNSNLLNNFYSAWLIGLGSGQPFQLITILAKFIYEYCHRCGGSIDAIDGIYWMQVPIQASLLEVIKLREEV